jgi:hypothetical protein
VKLVSFLLYPILIYLLLFITKTKFNILSSLKVLEFLTETHVPGPDRSLYDTLPDFYRRPLSFVSKRLIVYIQI